jgi:hypothetical protein
LEGRGSARDRREDWRDGAEAKSIDLGVIAAVEAIPVTFLTTREAGPFLGLSPRTLEKHRTSGTGPLYRKLGGRVVYAAADLIAWADRGVRQSTSDRPENPIEPAGRRKVSCG